MWSKQGRKYRAELYGKYTLAKARILFPIYLIYLGYNISGCSEKSAEDSTKQNRTEHGTHFLPPTYTKRTQAGLYDHTYIHWAKN